MATRIFLFLSLSALKRDKIKHSDLHPKRAIPLSVLGRYLKRADGDFILDLASLPGDYELAKENPSVLRTDAEWLKMEDDEHLLEFIQPNYSDRIQ